MRIKESPETLAAGVAGLEGDVYGFTTPSVTKIDVIGGAPDDVALNVSIGASSVWLRPDLLEFIDHNAGMVITVGKMKAMRQADGSWEESLIVPPADAQQGFWGWLKLLVRK